MSILDNLKNLASKAGVNLEDGLSLEDLKAVSGKVSDLAGQYGLDPQDLAAKIGDIKNLAGEGLDVSAMASKVGLPEDLVSKVLDKLPKK